MQFAPHYNTWRQERVLWCRWVEGELLRFASNNPATRGAELGFVWTVPQDKRYLVLLNKIELDDPVEAHNEEQP